MQTSMADSADAASKDTLKRSGVLGLRSNFERDFLSRPQTFKALVVTFAGPASAVNKSPTLIPVPREATKQSSPSRGPYR
jgi:hypothetical protein